MGEKFPTICVRDSRILVGDVRAALRSMEAGSVHMACCSPPYWGLRAYGTQPQVWGGDPECEHEWIDSSIDIQKDRTTWAQATNGRGEVQGTVQEFRRGGLSTSVRGTCLRCGAWRGELGSEPTPEQYVANIVEVFAEVWRVLRDDGTCWINLGDSFSSGGRKSFGTWSEGSKQATNTAIKSAPRAPLPKDLKPKDLIGIPWRVAFALQAAGWYLRMDIIWAKRSPMPESVTDRPTKSHEYVFLLSKRERYFYDRVAVMEQAASASAARQKYGYKNLYGHIIEANSHSDKRRPDEAKSYGADDWSAEKRNLRSVWSLSNAPYKGAHFATFPPKLVIPCIKAGTSEHGVCPECGAPWRRLTSRSRKPTRPGNGSKVGRVSDDADSPYHDHKGMVVGNRDPQRHVSVTETVGWEPTCKCPHKTTIPATVLDPFLGSGTTASVANYLGRYATGCELNAEYAELARQRIEAGYVPPKPKSTRRRKAAKRQRELFEGSAV